MTRIPSTCLGALLSIALTLVAAPHASARDAIQAITDWNSDVPASDLQDKYCKMAVTPFTFYRGSNHLYWSDFVNDKRLVTFGNDKTKIWLQGDLHVENFGVFDDADGNIVYNINDFDDSVIADYQFDVWRAATSMVLVMRLNNQAADKKLFGKDDQKEILYRFINAYLETIDELADNNEEEEISFTTDNTKSPVKKLLSKTEKKKSRDKMLSKWTEAKGKDRKFLTNSPKLGAVDKSDARAIEAAFANYIKTLKISPGNSDAHFKIKDIARRLLAGTGSLGTTRYYVLIEGESSSADDDRILDIKGQSLPSPLHYLGDDDRASYRKNFANNAARHQQAYLALTRASDPYLGWILLEGKEYSVRERSPFKETLDTSKLTDLKDFSKFAETLGAVLAVAHARADKDAAANCAGSDLIPYSVDDNISAATKGDHKAFRKQVRDIAFAYADQVEADYKDFMKNLVPKDCSSIEID